MKKPVVLGWAMEAVGTAVWIYGYFASGHPSILDWHTFAPWWIADWLRNFESEIGMAFIFAGMIPIYWPDR